MRNGLKGFLAALLAAVLCLSSAAAELTDVDESILTDAQPVEEKDGYHFNAKGFLVGSDNPGEEYWLEDEENGVWQYSGRSLCVKITRFQPAQRVYGAAAEEAEKNKAQAAQAPEQTQEQPQVAAGAEAAANQEDK